MSQLVLLRPEAEADLNTAWDWYEQRRTELGLEFLDEVAAAIRMLSQDPERERLYFRNFRRILLRRFPYKLFY